MNGTRGKGHAGGSRRTEKQNLSTEIFYLGCGKKWIISKREGKNGQTTYDTSHTLVNERVPPSVGCNKGPGGGGGRGKPPQERHLHLGYWEDVT